MRSVMQHNFSMVPQANIPRSSFDRSHGLKTTFNGGQLVPIFVDEVLPGDTFNLSLNTFARLATPLHPVMDNMHIDYFFFFVPNRLVMTNWGRLNGAQDKPGDSTDFLVPQTSVTTNYNNVSLAGYMGIPTYKTGFSYSCLPMRAYDLIYNEWFRDENLQDSKVISLSDTGDAQGTEGDAGLPYLRGKRHDYFTSCLPWPQKGTAVTIPLGTTAPLKTLTGYAPGNALSTRNSSGSLVNLGTATGTNPVSVVQTATAGGAGNELVADLSTATAATVNALRTAFQTQIVFERDARGGTRYPELIKAHFGVTNPDFRLQRPEYLGGGSSPLNIHPIAQTSATVAGQTPQGNLGAMGTSSAQGIGFVKSFTEHGHIIGIVNVRCDLTYQNGLDRMWSRRTRFDHYLPALAHLGEQAVKNKELFISGTPATDDATFGFQERWSEYRHKKSMITGKFKSNDPVSLDSWHCAQDFSSTPLLNAAFIKDTSPMSRILAVSTEPQILMDLYFNLKCARPMPTYSIPGNIDRF